MIFIKEYDLIKNNQKDFIICLDNSLVKFQKMFGNDLASNLMSPLSYQRAYFMYNIFTLSSTNILMYQLFNQLKSDIRAAIGDDRPLWLQSWLNYHKDTDVLNWHNHFWKWHGYICIEPKKTNTVFENWTVENTPGLVYFGHGYVNHKVDVLEKYEGYRITLGYDVTDEINHNNDVVGLIPI